MFLGLFFCCVCSAARIEDMSFFVVRDSDCCLYAGINKEPVAGESFCPGSVWLRAQGEDAVVCYRAESDMPAVCFEDQWVCYQKKRSVVEQLFLEQYVSFLYPKNFCEKVEGFSDCDARLFYEPQKNLAKIFVHSLKAALRGEGLIF